LLPEKENEAIEPGHLCTSIGGWIIRPSFRRSRRVWPTSTSSLARCGPIRAG